MHARPSLRTQGGMQLVDRVWPCKSPHNDEHGDHTLIPVIANAWPGIGCHQAMCIYTSVHTPSELMTTYSVTGSQTSIERHNVCMMSTSKPEQYNYYCRPVELTSLTANQHIQLFKKLQKRLSVYRDECRRLGLITLH